MVMVIIVSWNWKANGQGSANTDGSINTTYTSANTTSVVFQYQLTQVQANATVGHGLGVHHLVICKQLKHSTMDNYHRYRCN